MAQKRKAEEALPREKKRAKHNEASRPRRCLFCQVEREESDQGGVGPVCCLCDAEWGCEDCWHEYGMYCDTCCLFVCFDCPDEFSVKTCMVCDASLCATCDPMSLVDEVQDKNICETCALARYSP